MNLDILGLGSALAPRSRWLMILDWRPVAEPIHIACDGNLDAYNLCKAEADIKRDACKSQAGRNWETCIATDASIISVGSGVAGCVVSRVIKSRGGGVTVIKWIVAGCAVGGVIGGFAGAYRCNAKYDRDVEDFIIKYGTDLRLCYLRHCISKSSAEPSYP